MERPYRNIGFLFLSLFALVVVGFTPRIEGTPFFGYFAGAPRFAGVPPVVHFHAAMCIIWFALLITQPFLIRANHRDAHRLLGKFSIVVVVLFAISVLLVLRHQYALAIARLPRDAALSALLEGFLGMSLAVLYYTLAYRNRCNFHLHVAFVVAAALTFATPGLARFGLYFIGGMQGIAAVALSIYGILAGFLLYDRFRLRRPMLRSPYLALIPAFMATHVVDVFGSGSVAWRWIADKIVVYGFGM